MKILYACKSLLYKLKTFEIDVVVSDWWKNELPTAKTAFVSGLIIGFTSHLFVYTNRFFGNHDAGAITYNSEDIGAGRWLGNTPNNLMSYGYVIPLITGIFVTLFLTLSAFYICKMFHIRRRINAVIIAALLTTFPSIAFQNLFLFSSSQLSLGVLFAVLAVYITVRYKRGYLVGSILVMLTLTIYQANFNITVALCVFHLLINALGNDYSFKSVRNLFTRFLLMGGLGGVLYGISIAISFYIHNSTFRNVKGFSYDSISQRLFSVNGIVKALTDAIWDFINSFFGEIYVVVDGLLYAYFIFAGLAFAFIVKAIINRKIYRQVWRLLLIFVLFALVPLACNFAGILSTMVYGLMIYSFVLVLVLAIIISENCEIIPIIRSAFIVCAFIIVANFVISNNIFYLKAFYFNQRFESLSTRIVDRIDPILPLIESDTSRIAYFGGLPNEHYPAVSEGYKEFGYTDDQALGNDFFIMISHNQRDNFWRSVFIQSLRTLHGLPVYDLDDDTVRDQLEEMVLDTNMPVWPAEGSVGIVNDVIVINFGIKDE